MIEEDAVGDEESIGFAVVDAVPVGGDLGYGIGAAGVEGGGLILGRVGGAEHFRGPGLVDADLLAAGLDEVADGFVKAEGAGGDDVGGVFGLVEADADVGLGGEVVVFRRV